MTNKKLNVLFLCTGNSARSIIAEALLNHLGQGRFIAWSAGSQPKGAVHPLSLTVLRKAGLATEGLRSKSWDEFATADAPSLDLIITVCDNAAGETCPLWPGHPATAHWSYPDPAAVQGSEAQQMQAFEQTLHAMQRRLQLLVNLPEAKLERMALEQSARGLVPA